MSWLNDFKSALVSENLDRIEYLINNYPPKLAPDQLECTAALLKRASKRGLSKQREI